MLKTIKKRCEICNKKFEALFADHKRGRARFCSLRCACSRPRKRSGNTYVCPICNKSFYRCTSHLKKSKSGLLFCSRKCKDAAQKIGGISKIWPAHYGTGNGKHQYRIKAFKKLLHRCAVCHATLYIGIYPVHHIDFNRNHNHISNLLIVCHVCHAVIHAFRWKRIKITDPVELHLLNNLPKLNLLSRSPN